MPKREASSAGTRQLEPLDVQVIDVAAGARLCWTVSQADGTEETRSASLR